MAVRMLIGVTCLATFLGCCFAQYTENAAVGVFFNFKIEKKDFVSDAGHTEVRFTASEFGAPDLPKWLRLEQDTPANPAYIYGTPPVGSPSNFTIEITGWDKTDYSTARKNLTIHIDDSKSPPRYIAEFSIKNYNLDRFLLILQPDIFKDEVQKVWQSNALQVTKVESFLDRGGRVPIPPNKEGVFIAIGGADEYTLLKADYLGCKGLKPAIRFDPTGLWVIDWCKLRLVDTKPVAPTGNSSLPSSEFGYPILKSSYSPPEMRPVPRDFGDLYVAVLILPLIIVLIIVIILAIIMCCCREGKAKRDAATPRPQREYHDSILRTTFQLRKMNATDENDERDGSRGDHTGSEPPPSHTSTPYGRSSSNDDDNPRGAPPPYRMPPPAAVSVTTPNGNQFYPSDE